MNIIYSAKKDSFWCEVAKKIEHDCNYIPVYWVGADAGGWSFNGCFYHDVWDAFSLENTLFLKYEERIVVNITEYSRLEYYNYLKILDRVDAGSFAFSERDELFKRQLSYWESVLNKLSVDCVVFSNAPHLPYDYPLYLVAKKMNIKSVMFNVTSICGWHYVTYDLGGCALKKMFVTASENEMRSIYDEAVVPFNYFEHRKPWYLKKQDEEQKNLKLKLQSVLGLSTIFFFLVSLKKMVKSKSVSLSAFYYSGKWSSLKFYRGKYERNPVDFIKASQLKRRSLKIKKLLKKEYLSVSEVFDTKSMKYIYFPVHYQPELTTTPLGGDASDQFYVIRKISKSLPKGYMLVVKEHPSQFSNSLWGEQGRSLGCWKLVSELENVILCDMEIGSISLIKDCEAVVTVTGTAGWEAIVNDKPCVIFGGAWYQNFPCVVKASIDCIELAINEVLSLKCVHKIGYVDLSNCFFGMALKNDLHGVLGGKVERNSYNVADYLKKML